MGKRGNEGSSRKSENEESQTGVGWRGSVFADLGLTNIIKYLLLNSIKD